MNLKAILEDQQKKFVLDFKAKKTEELKMLLDNELWKQSQVNPLFQKIVDRLNSIEEFEKQEKLIES